ncbi:hypothetical protein BaRGS_00001708 [Batillaria attramentaria]|uniref:Uncharacterized protein n=1 Tax=Batillaria attramentaria TaxID=370345 RepID=A0ABD0M5T2_9CAEN
MFSRRKKTVLTLLCLCSVLYVAVQVMHYQEEFHPLQALSTAEQEAQRLLKFMTSYHYQCNNTLHSSNYSDWSICIEADTGVNVESSVPKIAYSIGPVSDFSFETILSRNLSFQQYVFLHDTSSTAPPPLLQLNGTTVYRTAIVPNDPADFGRNSYNMQTINSIMATLHHRHIDILKLESVQDMSHSYEVLYFMVKDGILARFQQLHISLEIDKVDDNYLYGWYKTLYSLFHSAGFRLYHTAASSPLCLQVTMMESCRYFTSWVRNPGPRTFVYYPPAIDGSAQYEEQRLEDFLDRPSQLDEDVIPVKLSPYTTLRLSRRVLMSGSDSCTILIFQDETSRREVMGLADIISHYLFSQSTKVVFLDLRHVTWQFLTPFLDSGALQKVDQLEIMTPMFKVPADGRQPAQMMRLQYSELQRILAYQMALTEASPLTKDSLRFRSSGDLWRLTFVKK